MAKIIILANSFRDKNRCLAGIDKDTGKWVRPLRSENQPSIPNAIGGRIGILDLIEMPLRPCKNNIAFKGRTALLQESGCGGERRR